MWDSVFACFTVIYRRHFDLLGNRFDVFLTFLLWYFSPVAETDASRLREPLYDRGSAVPQDAFISDPQEIHTI